MSFPTARYLIAATEAGLLIIHSTPITLSWVPRDVVNDLYNVGGTVTVGTFDSLDEARQAARDQYPLTAEDRQATEILPFDTNADSRTEIHTPAIDGHKVMHHKVR